MILNAQEVETFFGTFTVREPVLLELMETKAMQRLKEVQQTGVLCLVKGDHYSFTRYEHSIGVCMLCRMFGASLQEQVAALLHDVSHTVFSHVGDVVFGYQHNYAYQDEIHEWYISQTDVLNVLHAHSMTAVITDESKNTFTVLEQDLPDICADRLEYNLHAGLKESIITYDDSSYILRNIRYNNGRWYFIDIRAARLFAYLTITLTKRLWGAPYDGFMYQRAASALRRALDIGIISTDDIHFSTDNKVWQILCASNDAIIDTCLKQLYNYEHSYIVSSEDDFDYHFRPKCRAVDPLVQYKNSLLRLSDIDDDFAQCYNDLKQCCQHGFYLKYINA